MQLFQTWKGKLFTGSLFLHRLILKRYGMDIFFAYNRIKLNDFEPRSATLELMSREIYRYDIQGSCAEVGVYRGDFAKEINHYFPDRKLYLFDTFEGFDKRDIEITRKNEIAVGEGDFSQTSVDIVLSKMEHKENVIVKKGWFPETANGVDDKFCFVSLDADLYKPIKAGLEFFYPRLVNGGIIMVHDFNYSLDDYTGVHDAVKEFCLANNTGYVCLSDSAGSAAIVK